MLISQDLIPFKIQYLISTLQVRTTAKIPAILLSLAMAASSHAAWVTLVEHNFGGASATNLNGVAADTFDSTKITGVTGNWVAATEFKADGSVTATSRAAHLNLGGYIDAAKGTSAGLFRLTATYDVTVRWLSVGFSSLSAPATNNDFTDSSVGGLGTMYAFTTTSGGALTLYTSDVLVEGNGQRGATGAYTNPLTLMVELDYRTWNGTTDFGKVTYFAGGAEVHSFTFTSATGTMARSILLSTNHSSASGDYGKITLQRATGEPDTTPPTLIGISDDKGGGPVAVGTPITYTVTFSEDMDGSTVDASDFNTAGTAIATIDSVTQTSPRVFAVRVTPTTTGALQLLILATSVLSDTATPANHLDTTSDILDDTIITVVEIAALPLTLSNLTPPDDGFTAIDSNFVVTFNKPVTAGTGFITLKRKSDDSTVEAFDVASSSRIGFGGTQVTIDPSTDLADQTSYYVEIDATAIKDDSGNFFAGLAGSDAWNFTTSRDGATVASGSGNLSLDIDNSGVIRNITLGAGDGGTVFQRASLGESRFANTTTDSVAVQKLPSGARVVREIQNTQGRKATVTETFGPGLEDDSISWEMVIESPSAAWTTSLQTYFQMSPNAGDLKFWSAWTRTDLPVFNGYPNPLVPMPFSTLDLRFGGEGVSSYVNNGFSVPIASWLNESGDRALSLVQSPFDFLQEMKLQTDATGAVRFHRTDLRIGGGNTIRLHMQLVAHPADWRAGLGFMTRQYPAAFDPHNPEAHVVGGGGTYADYRGETIDAARYRQMGLTMNWNARFPWPYLGMSIPPVKTDTEEWMSFLWSGYRDSTPQSAQVMNDVADAFRRQGFHQLEYFTLTEAGAGIVNPAPPRKAADDADLWKDPNDFIYYQIPNANLGIVAWNGARVVDPGDPAWQTEILRQITDLSNRLPSSSGICIDRLDWLNRYNSNGDDGVTWTGSPKRSLMFSWHDAMQKLLLITKARNKVVFVNSHTMRRIDILRHSDGFYAEQRGTGIHHMLAFAGARKPVVIWNSPAETPTAFQEGLYLGFHHSIPFPKADHNTNPNASLENWFLNYGPLYNAMRGRKWLLLPGIIKVTSANALANIFEVDSGFVIPVVFGGSATSATVELGALPISQLHSVEVLHPGVGTATPITPTQQGDGMVLTVPLVNGCAMVRVLADKAVAAPPADPAPEFKLLPEGSWNLEWNGRENHTYFVQQSDNLADWYYFPVIKSGADSRLSFGGDVDPTAHKQFFRLVSTDQPSTNPYLDDFNGDGISNWADILAGHDPLSDE
jgi:hypothetical protein